MRWDDLFADLDAQASALEVAARAGEIEERARIEFAAVRLLDRLRACAGAPVRLRLLGGHELGGAAVRFGSGWVLLDGGGHEVIVPLGAICTVRGLTRWSAPPAPGPVALALPLRAALRGVARDRSATRLHLADGDVIDATIDRVGADFVDVARHPAGEPRRASAVRETVTVPLAAIAALRRVLR